MQDYLKLYRSFLDWEWYRNSNTKILFLHMMLKANWKDGKFQGMEIPRGSFVSSIETLALETGLTINKVRTALKNLQNTGEVHKQITGKFTLFFVLNYDLYQGGSQANHKQITGKSQEGHKQITTIEERKKERNKENKVFDTNVSHTFCPEVTPPGSETAIEIPLNNGTTYNVTLADVERYSELYQGISVMAELRKMVGWCEANPTRRKTRNGVKRFITNWLSRQQDQAPRVQGGREAARDESQSSAKLW